jgi:hypothetical protein
MGEINNSLKQICEIINNKVHTRFKISRQEMFNIEEQKVLKPLPEVKYELCDTKFCKVHPDGTICLNLRYYSVPYLLVGESVFVKTYSNSVEIFHKLKKVAVHQRLSKFKGEKSILVEHIPESSQAYKNTTVQFIVQQALFIDPHFKDFIERLLQESPCGNLRKAQGFVREARIIKGKISSELFHIILIKSLNEMHRFNQIRVEKFKNYLKHYLEENLEQPVFDHIKRGQDNPMLRRNQILH